MVKSEWTNASRHDTSFFFFPLKGIDGGEEEEGDGGAPVIFLFAFVSSTGHKVSHVVGRQ